MGLGSNPHTRRGHTQNRENNPMQSRMGPTRRTHAAGVGDTRRPVVTAHPVLL